jgi:hypothetical protein
MAVLDVHNHDDADFACLAEIGQQHALVDA